MNTSKEEMIRLQLEKRGIYNPQVLQAMSEIDRIDFIPDDMKHKAYDDGPLPIGKGQTISQPYIVAYMAQHLQLQPHEKVLEIGTGCGYNAAVLSKLAKEIYSIEIIEWLHKFAVKNLNNSGVKNIHTRNADGYKGWPENAPFDAIILTAAPPEVPQTLKEQLKIGGRLLAPVGRRSQELVLITRTGENTYKEKILLLVNFVPMTGKARK
ncbi:protein-L-isoaspartate(D-aspartate) O-methyltransferase [Autumnicola edwardsiae]|uniref:Protein-L-isoaspartate O-methyltransferase n=1 Tax=Autumnicola edwardsiae TaxID=3075594 RepID=A0ABU3CUA6_9FLAO|nr:protein-L-isoaspartate(D-aspartate) O-methyltransferase [Zunongwangia sp. F297]MDT0649941.1 protein-L-isoaspartate(D-aspartate) O-methyltransferase [Zunongwangia sp. F297]